MPDMIDFPDPTLVSVNGVELEVFEAGRENKGKPIVLCHGWPGHAFSWRHQMPALAAAHCQRLAPAKHPKREDRRLKRRLELSIAATNREHTTPLPVNAG